MISSAAPGTAIRSVPLIISFHRFIIFTMGLQERDDVACLTHCWHWWWWSRLCTHAPTECVALAMGSVTMCSLNFKCKPGHHVISIHRQKKYMSRIVLIRRPLPMAKPIISPATTTILPPPGELLLCRGCECVLIVSGHGNFISTVMSLCTLSHVVADMCVVERGTPMMVVVAAGAAAAHGGGECIWQSKSPPRTQPSSPISRRSSRCPGQVWSYDHAWPAAQGTSTAMPGVCVCVCVCVVGVCTGHLPTLGSNLLAATWPRPCARAPVCPSTQTCCRHIITPRCQRKGPRGGGEARECLHPPRTVTGGCLLGGGGGRHHPPQPRRPPRFPPPKHTPTTSLVTVRRRWKKKKKKKKKKAQSQCQEKKNNNSQHADTGSARRRRTHAIRGGRACARCRFKKKKKNRCVCGGMVGGGGGVCQETR